MSNSIVRCLRLAFLSGPGSRVTARRVSVSSVLVFSFLLGWGGPARLVAANATLPDGTLRRAEKALQEGEFEQADKLFREVLSKDARDLGARCGLSYALFKLRKLNAAYEQATIAVEQDRNSARAQAILGTIILATGDFPQAEVVLRNALSLNENTALAVAGIAMIDFYENRQRESLNGLRRASFLDPEEPDFIFALGQIAARSEHYKEAADAYERFLRVAPRTDSDRRDRIRGLIDFLRYLNVQGQLYVVGGGEQTSLRFRSPDSRPQMDVRINGNKKPLNFVLDTGSGMSVISEETAQKLGVKAVARGGQARGVGGPGRFDIVYGFVDSMEIGDVKIENVPVYIRKFYHGSGIDGYIGLSVISKFAAVADYKDNMFTLTRQRPDTRSNIWKTLYKVEAPDEKRVPESIQIPIRTTGSGFLSGQVEIEGIEGSFNFIIDTGASISVIGEDLFQREIFKRYVNRAPLRVYGAAGVTENVTSLMLPRVRLGPHQSENVSAAVLDLDIVNETTGFEQMGILGGNFLRNYRVTFDFPRGLILLEPITRGATGGESERGPASQPQT